MENILILNLLGQKFDIPYKILLNYPETLLGNKILLSKYYRHDRNDYYFERNPLLFSYILTYYTLEKKIFCPHSIPIELLENECQFFQLNNPNIYHEINQIQTYHYFSRNIQLKQDYFIEIIPLFTGILFMITISMETTTTTLEKTFSLSLCYFIELISTLLLTSTIIYQLIFRKNYFFLFDFTFTLLSILIIIIENIYMMINYSILNNLILLLKIVRLFIVIVHLRILRLIILTFIQRLQTICVLVFINIILIGSLGEITFAFERRLKQDEINQSTMKTHLDAFWWATSLSFTIGFGPTDPHSTLTIIGRFCSYMLTFFGLLFNGLILQELIKGFLKIYRQERRDQ